MNTVHLLYCGNDDDYDEILLSLLSVMRHTRRRLGVYLLTALIDRYDGAPVRPSKIAYLSALLKSRQDGSYLVFRDMSAPFEREFTSFLEKEGRRSPCYLLRLLADMADLPSKVLFLDGNTVAAGDVGVIYDYDLKGQPFAGVKDRSGLLWGFLGGVNQGVLLFDMTASKEKMIFHKARKAFRNRNGAGLLESEESTLCLPRRFNEQRGLRKDTVLRHYCTTFSLLPYPHVNRYSAFERQTLPKRERERFSREIDRFYFCRDAYLEYEKNEG